MTTRIRILVALSRPPVFLLLGLYAAIGMAGAVPADDFVMTARVLLPLAACQLFCVAANDLPDQAIDAVNLAGDRSRPLVWGVARREMTAVAAV